MNIPLADPGRQRPPLTIDLQEGFDGEEVVIRLGDREVFRRDDVRTRMQIGRAASIELETDGSEQQLELLIPNRHLSHALTIDPRRHPYVGFSILEGKLRSTESVQPFGYV